jgi:hypothetical protein
LGIVNLFWADKLRNSGGEGKNMPLHFTAALAMGLLHNWDRERINRHANEIAAYVVSQPGATPRLPDRLVAPFRQYQPAWHFLFKEMRQSSV